MRVETYFARRIAVADGPEKVVFEAV